MHMIGPHTSIAGGLQNALISAHELGANALGMFTKNQRQWKAKPLDPEEIALFVKTCESLDFSSSQILVHDSYLINLANPDSVKRRQSLDAFIDELKRVEQLGLKLLNFHPGSHLNQVDAREGLRLVAESLDIALSETGNAIAVIENTAGQGSNLGSNFEELAYLYEQCRTQERVGFCIDTCHAHAAGYNLGSIEEFEKAIARFDTLIGLDKLRGMHLNDAKSTYGSRVDRHAPLGAGNLGLEPFKAMMGDSRFENIPLILETTDPELWSKEIEMLRSFSIA